MGIVVDPPRFDSCPGVLQRFELHDVQALIPQAPVERLYVPVFRGLSRPDEVQLHTSPVGLVFQRSRGELCSVIHGDRYRRSGTGDGSIQRVGYILAAKSISRLQQR